MLTVQRATAFIFDTQTGVLVKVSKFLRQKLSRPEIFNCVNSVSAIGDDENVPAFKLIIKDKSHLKAKA